MPTVVQCAATSYIRMYSSPWLANTLHMQGITQRHVNPYMYICPYVRHTYVHAGTRKTHATPEVRTYTYMHKNSRRDRSPQVAIICLALRHSAKKHYTKCSIYLLNTKVHLEVGSNRCQISTTPLTPKRLTSTLLFSRRTRNHVLLVRLGEEAGTCDI